MGFLNPWVLLAIFAVIVGSYAGGRIQQRVYDAKAYQKKEDALVAKALADTQRVEKELGEAREAEQRRQLELVHERDRQVLRAQERVKKLDPAIAAVRVPDVGRLLNDTLGDSAKTAGPAREPEKAATPAAEGADTSVALWTQWSVDVIAICTAYRDTIVGWQRFYSDLQKAH